MKQKDRQRETDRQNQTGKNRQKETDGYTVDRQK